MLELGLGLDKNKTTPELAQLRFWIEGSTNGRKKTKQTKTQKKTKRSSKQQISFLRYYNPSLGGNWFDPQTYKNKGAKNKLAKNPSVDAAQSMWNQNQKYLRFN